MEEPQKDSGQSPNCSVSEPELMVIDDDGAEKFNNMDEGSNDSPIHVDEGQTSMDVDVKGKTSLDDESCIGDINGKSSSEPCSNVPIDMSVESLEKFCKEASRSFFDEIGLISHQINSYNEFVSHGLQELFNSLGEIIVDPGYDPSKKVSGAWKHAIIKFGRVKLEKPVFLSGNDEVDIDLKPRHARLQNMTYASKIKVEVTIQVQNISTLYICQSFVRSAIIPPKMSHTFIQDIESMARKMNKL